VRVLLSRQGLYAVSEKVASSFVHVVEYATDAWRERRGPHSYQSCSNWIVRDATGVYRSFRSLSEGTAGFYLEIK